MTFINGILPQVIDDSKKDQVNEKRYTLCEEKGQVLVEGIVEEYEHETIWIEFMTLNSKTMQRLTEIFDHYEFAFGSGALFRPVEESVEIFEKGIQKIKTAHNRVDGSAPK